MTELSYRREWFQGDFSVEAVALDGPQLDLALLHPLLGPFRIVLTTTKESGSSGFDLKKQPFSSFTWYMDEMVWKSGLEGSRSTTRCALYIEMFFFTVVYLRIMVLQSVR